MKRQMNLSNRLKTSKGITLIALIITIIVLLILAGVTINAITGNENVMEKAQQARSENEQADELDSIKLAVVDAVAKGTDGKVSKDKLEEVLEGLIEGNIEGGDTNPWTVKGKITGKAYKITENGEVTKILTEEEKKERQTAINAKIGNKVEYENQENNVNSQYWRIFYASEEEMFLIAAQCVSYQGLILRDYTNSNDVFNPKTAEAESGYTYKNVTYGEKYNSKWKTQLNRTTNTNENSKATAYLCDPENWEKYISPTAPEGTYAVGGPTKEVLMKSWNEAVKNDLMEGQVVSLEGTGVTKDGYPYKEPDYLYTDKPMKQDKLDCLYNNGSNYWLASPSFVDPGYMCAVGKSGMMSFATYSSELGVRPLVSIPISNVQIDGKTVKIVK